MTSLLLTFKALTTYQDGTLTLGTTSLSASVLALAWFLPVPRIGVVDDVQKETTMGRRAELVGGLGACILGLICVLMEAQALANPVGNPTISWLLGTGIYSGIGNAIANTQQALLPMAVVLAVLALGAYVHVVHGNVAGLVLLISSSAIVIVSSGFIVFTPPYVAILFVPAPLVVFTAVLAGAASVCGLSSLEPGKPHLPHISLRVGSSRHTRSREAL